MVSILRQNKEWRCNGYWCWLIGYMCTTWWLLCFLYCFLPATLMPGFQVHESPGVRLSYEGVNALHPVVLVPGILTGGLELWEGRPCADGLFRKPLCGGGSFAEILKRPLCWLEHLSLHNETGLDPPGIRVRAVPGLHYTASGYFVWAALIKNLAEIGYEGKNLYMVAYDWRLSFQNTEVRDQALSRLKSNIELMFATNGNKKVVVVPHSMGAIYFLHFLKWVEAPPPMGGGGGPGWCAKHIKVIMNISPAFLGIPKAVSNIFSVEGKDAFPRAVALAILNFNHLGLQKLEHVIQVCRTWDSIISLMPKGGETIWGDLDWSAEERYNCEQVKKGYVKHCVSDNNYNVSDLQRGIQVEKSMKHGRVISFGKTVSQFPASLLPSLHSQQEIPGKSDSATLRSLCDDVGSDYDEMSKGSIQKVAKSKAYTTTTVFDPLHFMAPKMKKRAEAQFSQGIAEKLDDPKYAHYKYWSNPLETKLPDAPDMEIYCLHGVGIPTESSDGDESLAVVSAGFMCAKGWRGRTRFNPSGMATYIREYLHQHKQHAGGSSLLEGRGLESGVARTNIMRHVGLIEDVLRVAGGAKGADIGGDRIFSDVMRMSERMDLRL